MGSLRVLGKTGIGLKTSQNVVPCIAISSRHYADDVKFLKSIDTAHMRRGRGGRSSFSGTVCTVFGGSGFIGRYVANRLGKVGTQMIFPYRGEFYDMRPLKVCGDLGQVLFCPFDIRDEDTIAKAVKYSDAVVNLIGRDWSTRNFTMEQVQVEGAERIARVCKKVGVEKFIHLSALNADRDHEGYLIEGGSPLLRAKRDGEAAVRAAFPEAIVIRPSDVWGQEDRFLRYYSKWFRADMRAFSIPKGGYGIYKQPVYVGDLAEAIVNCVTKDMGEKGQIYQAVGPRRYELREMIEWFLRVLRYNPEIQGGYTVLDLKYFPVALIKAKINELLPFWPMAYLTTDRLERETVTDVVSRHLPSLEDLGVSSLTKMEDRIEWELKSFRNMEYFQEELGDFPPVAPPKYVETYGN